MWFAANSASLSASSRLAGPLENVICSYPEYSPGHGTHPRPDSAVVIAGPDQAHITIAGPDDLANVVVMAGTPDHHRADLRRCSSTPIPPIAGEIVFATGVRANKVVPSEFSAQHAAGIDLR
jgi:hypothetical protein